MRAMVKFFRANPQALVLLIICLILGFGTFIAVLISLAQHSNGTLSGEPSGVIALAGAIIG
jgi:hypothetical protein